MDNNKVAVIGAGSWGTALSLVLDENKFDVVVWTKREEQVQIIEETSKNGKYLPNTTIPKSIKFTTDIKEAIDEAYIVVLAVPSIAVKSVVEENKHLFCDNQIIVNVAKGFEPKTGQRLSVAIKEALPKNNIVILSGPSHAEEVAEKLATTVVASCKNENSAKTVQEVFSNSYFRVYTNTDVIGVEIGGALKNVIALVAGVADGIGLGDNTKAAIMTRGMAEVARFGVSIGGKQETFYGLTGMGDLIVTCGSMHSRNRRAGILIGKGKSIDDVLKEVGMVVEGIEALKILKAENSNTENKTPLVDEIYDVIFNKKDPKKSLIDLMTRGPKREC